MNKQKKKSKLQNCSSFQNLKSTFFPEMVKQENLKRIEKNPPELGVVWANETITNILARSNA